MIEHESVNNSSQRKRLEKIRTQIMIVIWRKTPQMTVQWLAELGFEVMSKQGLGDLLQRALAGKCHLEEGRAT